MSKEENRISDSEVEFVEQFVHQNFRCDIFGYYLQSVLI